MEQIEKQKWTLEIKPKASLFDIGLLDVWRYKDLLWLFVKRDVITVYQQTVLGIFWFFIPPILTTLTYMLVFNGIAKIPTNDAPPILFYLAGIVIWTYFSECLNRTSNTFLTNANIFGKVYFPRLIVPISTVISSLFKFLVQFSLFLIIYISYCFIMPGKFFLDLSILVLPYLIGLMAVFGMGLGIIFSSLTTKYRDFSYLITFGLQLLMFATPIIYPSSFAQGYLKLFVDINPLSPIVEGFRYAFLHTGELDWKGLIYSTGFATGSLLVGTLLFSRVERSFMDTI